uniref:UvrD-helicase domain-containing protein n=1 Tax=Candidatus Scatousia sp. TaxID=3085663 RepID=UPI0040253828
MFFYADLHIHSKYSRATSKSCNLEELAIWAQKKGLGVISTGDFTHPAWFAEIQEKLVPGGNGVFRLRPDIEKEIFKTSTPVRFILSVEISTIYKKWDKTRKVHHVVFVPDMEAAGKFRDKLGSIGNIKSDGRPILGLDSRDLLEITLESGEGSYIIPAHIWTPWFSVLGSKSGFDSIEDCYGDLSEHIFAVETGLSSDPEMNWKVSKLDKYRLVSNSDAHSPSKLAREATVFDTEPDYYSIMNALKTGIGYVGTVEFFPEEGKYHEDGHRKCNVCLSPQESLKFNNICPVCGKPLTIGVLNRVCALADRSFDSTFKPSTAGEVFSLVPLQEIIAEINCVGAQSKSVVTEYERLIRKFGSELSILREIPIDDLSKDSPLLGEGISRLRQGKVIKHAGYDGEYGVIRLFDDSELVKKNFVNLKLDIDIPQKTPALLPEEKTFEIGEAAVKHKAEDVKKSVPVGLDEFQESAVKNPNPQLLIVAGPGSGKTTVLTKRLAYMIYEQNVPAEKCLAITFTRKAAQEMRERLSKLLKEKAAGLNIHTFHSLCFSILKENFETLGLAEDFRVISKEEKSLYKEDELPENLLEFDELITLTLKLFRENPDILNIYKDRFKYVSVDEYQDIDEHQYELIKLLVPPDGNILAIGDPNQAIYGFRGGSAKFFNNFTTDYPNAEIINLKNNYRSTNTIVDASNQMIECFNIISKYDKPHEKITIHTAPTDKAEAEFIVSTIENMIGGHSFFSIDSERSEGQEGNYSFSDFAILYRTSTQLKPVLEALQRSGMPYVKLSNDLVCENKHIRNLLQGLNGEFPVKEQLININGEIDDYIFKYLVKVSESFTTRDEFIHEVSLLTEADTLDERADRISLMTLHASKGLEFKCVFIAGLEEGIMPLYRAQTEEEIAEEKRLLYVGMTRAEQRLFLSRAVKRIRFGKSEHPAPSPFLQKIEQDLLNLSRFECELKEKDNSNQLTLF